VFIQWLVNKFPSFVIESEEISLSSHETEEIVEEILDTLTLLDRSHE